jgi:hypothetical protein
MSNNQGLLDHSLTFSYESDLSEGDAMNRLDLVEVLSKDPGLSE